MAEEPGEGKNGDEKNPEQAEEQPARKSQKEPQEPLEQREQRLSPRPSFWPLFLALALVVTFIGIMTFPAILIAGVLLVVIAIIGWVLEKQ